MRPLAFKGITMASEVDLCNVALGHLGDAATVSSISPPEGSAQAEHCARFYPIARDALLATHAWGFATRRATPAQHNANVPGWQFSYAQPNNTVNILAVLGPDDPDPMAGRIEATGHPYVCESNSTGTPTIYCNVPKAVIHYIHRETNPDRFPALFATALTWQLASMLAGPLIKGESGMNEAKRCSAMAEVYIGQAWAADSNQRRVDIVHTPAWIAARGNINPRDR